MPERDAKESQLYAIYSQVHGTPRLRKNQFNLRTLFLRVTMAACVTGILTSGFVPLEQVMAAAFVLPPLLLFVCVLVLPLTLSVLALQSLLSPAEARPRVFAAGLATLRDLLVAIGFLLVIVVTEWLAMACLGDG